MVLMDSHILSMWDVWAFWYFKVSCIALQVIVLDAEAEGHVKQWNVSHQQRRLSLQRSFAFPPGRKLFPKENYISIFWFEMRKQLLEGRDVLHMDLDAFPFADPWSLLGRREVADVDILAPPGDFGKRPEMPHSVNMGFFFIRSNAVTRQFVSNIIALVAAKLRLRRAAPNDQLITNSELARLGCKFENQSHGQYQRGVCGVIKVAYHNLGYLRKYDCLQGRRGCSQCCSAKGCNATPAENAAGCARNDIVILHSKVHYYLHQNWASLCCGSRGQATIGCAHELSTFANGCAPQTSLGRNGIAAVVAAPRVDAKFAAHRRNSTKTVSAIEPFTRTITTTAMTAISTARFCDEPIASSSSRPKATALLVCLGSALRTL